MHASLECLRHASSLTGGGGERSAMRWPSPIGSRSVSQLPVLALRFAIGFRAQGRLVLPDGVAIAGAGGQADQPLVMREPPPMPTPASPAPCWSPCLGSANLSPNPAFERTHRYVASTWRVSARR